MLDFEGGLTNLAAFVRSIDTCDRGMTVTPLIRTHFDRAPGAFRGKSESGKMKAVALTER